MAPALPPPLLLPEQRALPHSHGFPGPAAADGDTPEGLPHGTAGKAAGDWLGASCQLGGSDGADPSPSKALDTARASRRKILVPLVASPPWHSLLAVATGKAFPGLWEDAWGRYRQCFNPDCGMGGAGDLVQGKGKELLLHPALGAHRQNTLGPAAQFKKTPTSQSPKPPQTNTTRIFMLFPSRHFNFFKIKQVDPSHL